MADKDETEDNDKLSPIIHMCHHRQPSTINNYDIRLKQGEYYK